MLHRNSLSTILLTFSMFINCNSMFNRVYGQLQRTPTKQRPFYNIAHMVNGISEIEHFLDLGANALESDIRFFANGSVKELLHGSPCDCFRKCDYTSKLSDYLTYVRNITDPSLPKNYYNKMALQILDMKLGSSGNVRQSGREVAAHVLDHLWNKEGRKQEIRVLFYFEKVSQSDVVRGILDEFRERGQEHRLKDVGFDGGYGSVIEIVNELSELGLKGRIWQGDGITNCFSYIWPTDRLQEALAIRDLEDGYISKVYHWTIDADRTIRKSLELDVDGILTNTPDVLVGILQEPRYKGRFTMAGIQDDAFALFKK